jgi:RNA polymerase primary sigma factor
MRPDAASDLTLVRAVLAGDAKASERLLRRVADTVWTACRVLTRDEADARDAFAMAAAGLREDGFRRLRPYDGRCRIETFVTLITRDLLAQRMLRLFQEDAHRGWAAFEAAFQADIRRLIQRRLPGQAQEETRRDAYQEVCVALIDDDYRRLRAYGGIGSFTGFVLHMVDRLLIDFIRSFSARRRAPAAIKRLAALDQEVFKLVHWEGMAPEIDGLVLALARRLRPVPDAAEIAAALARVQRSLPAGYRATAEAPVRITSLAEAPELGEDGVTGGPAVPSPEDTAIDREGERLLELAAAVVRDVAATLPEADRLYLRIALSSAEPLPAREVARLMQRPVEDIYKLKQRVLKRLKDALGDHEAVKNWRASV